MRSARIRAIASDGPPAENGTMMVMGRDGKFCATRRRKCQHRQQAAKLIFASASSNAPFQTSCVRSAATPCVSNHEATELAAILETRFAPPRMRTYSFA